VKLEILHRTIYRYGSAPRRAVQTLRLSPGDSAHQQVLSWQLRASGILQAHQDTWGNPSHLLTCERPTLWLRSESQGIVETRACAELIDPNGPPPMLYRRDSALAASHPELLALADTTFGQLPLTGKNAPQQGELLALAQAVTDAVRYGGGQTDANTNALQALRAGQGVCQDHAHVFIAVCRSLGLAARYVSGYFHAPDAPRLASHAWAEVCIDEVARRWLSIDVTHACLIDERHVRLAVGPDYAACPPVVGVRSGGGAETMEVQVEVRAV
jgi:transglutaminase-like putative cysteine protease